MIMCALAALVLSMMVLRYDRNNALLRGERALLFGHVFIRAILMFVCLFGIRFAVTHGDSMLLRFVICGMFLVAFLVSWASNYILIDRARKEKSRCSG